MNSLVWTIVTYRTTYGERPRFAENVPQRRKCGPLAPVSGLSAKGALRSSWAPSRARFARAFSPSAKFVSYDDSGTRSPIAQKTSSATVFSASAYILRRRYSVQYVSFYLRANVRQFRDLSSIENSVPRRLSLVFRRMANVFVPVGKCIYFHRTVC